MATQAVCVVSAVGVSRGSVEPAVQRLQEEGFELLGRRVLLASPGKDLPWLKAGAPEAADYAAGPSEALLLRLPAGADAGPSAPAALQALLPELEHAYGSPGGWEALRDRLALFPEPAGPPLERTLAVLKPGLEAEARAAAVAQVLEATGLVRLAEAEVTLSGDAARLLAADAANEEEVDYLAGERAVALVLEGAGAVDRLRLAAGPAAPAEARAAAPASVRARFGIDEVQNALHASATADDAAAEIAAVLPEPLPAQRLLVVAAAARADAVAAVLGRAGFAVAARRAAHLSEAGAAHLGLADAAVAGAVEAMLVDKPAAAATWDAVKAEAGRGAGVTADEAHFKLFFPQLKAAVLPGPDDVRSMLLSEGDNSLNSVLVGGLTHLCRTKPVGLAAVRELAAWLSANNPNKPRVVVPDDGDESEDEEVEAEEDLDDELEDEVPAAAAVAVEEVAAAAEPVAEAAPEAVAEEPAAVAEPAAVEAEEPAAVEAEEPAAEEPAAEEPAAEEPAVEEPAAEEPAAEEPVEGAEAPVEGAAAPEAEDAAEAAEPVVEGSEAAGEPAAEAEADSTAAPPAEGAAPAEATKEPAVADADEAVAVPETEA